METSAKTAHNVDAAFSKAAELILDQIDQGKVDPSNEVILKILLEVIFYRQLVSK